MKKYNLQIKNTQQEFLKSLKLLVWVIIPCFWLISCDDMMDKPKPTFNILDTESTGIYVLSEGLFNMNNSTLSFYNLKTNEIVTNLFTLINKRGLGDTGNDMALYGSKLYVVMNISSQVEVIDAFTGKSLKQIPLFNEIGTARQPRNIAFYNGKAYVCSFDGTLARIDTTTLQTESFVKCGRNPDGLCITNNKIYVTNSGGLEFPNYDNTVSVVDINTFTEIKKITVGFNPSKIQADSKGNVYLVARGNNMSKAGKFQKIDAIKDEFTSSFENIQALNFAIHNDTAYIYNYDFTSQESSVKVFDCKLDRIISNNFITDKTEITTPYGIDVNPVSGDVYLTDAKSYTVWGDVLCFNNKGVLKFKIQEIGLNPNKIVFAKP